MKILFLLLQFVITSFGAVNDSTIVQTEAIQKTVDAAAVKGGTVVIPRGVWLSGAIFFKPGTRLLLEEGAVLKGSTDVEDFPDIPVHIEGVLQPYVSALINADRCDGFTISGSGTLDGNGLPYWKAFWARRKENPACTNLEVRRPRMIGISNSSDITIEGIRLRNSAFWNIHLYKCRKVKVYGVDIFAPVKPVRAPSSDGIDLDACEDVHIRGCSFATCDDLIAIKGGKGPWHGDLSSPSLEMYPQVTDSYLSLNSLNNFLEAEIICFSSAPKRPKAITAPVTAPQVPSEKVPPIPPENPFARRANSSVGIPATSQIPIRVACEQL